METAKRHHAASGSLIILSDGLAPEDLEAARRGASMAGLETIEIGDSSSLRREARRFEPAAVLLAEGARAAARVDHWAPSVVSASRLVLPPDLVLVTDRPARTWTALVGVKELRPHCLPRPIMEHEAADLLHDILAMRRARLTHLASLSGDFSHNLAQRLSRLGSIQLVLQEAAAAFRSILGCGPVALLRRSRTGHALEMADGLNARRPEDVGALLATLVPPSRGRPAWQTLPRAAARALNLPWGRCLVVPVDASYVFLLFWPEGPHRTGHILADAEMLSTAVATGLEAARRRYAEDLADRRDPWTGLPGTEWLVDRLEARLEDGQTAHLLFVDIQGFLHLNATHGHVLGGKVLLALADILRGSAGPWVCRTGPDSFLAAFWDGELHRVLTVLSRGVTVEERLPNGERRHVTAPVDGKVVTVASRADLLDALAAQQP